MPRKQPWSVHEVELALDGAEYKGPASTYTHTAAQVAAMTGRTEKAVYRFRAKNQLSAPDLFHAPIEDLEPPLELDGDWIITGDLQAPAMDYDFSLLPALVAKKQLKKPRRILIAGDAFNADFASNYPIIVKQPTWEEEKAALEQIFIEWLTVFQEIVWLRGNHEDRVHRKTNAERGMRSILNEVCGDRLFDAVPDWPKRIRTSDWDYCYINTPLGRWRIIHGGNYSIDQLKVAWEYSTKFECHVWSHHEHHLAKGWSRNGKHILVNGGGLFDQNKLAFVAITTNKRPNMKKGFGMLRAGYPYLFGEEPFTNWQEWI